jgi:hypothetical protein
MEFKTEHTAIMEACTYRIKEKQTHTYREHFKNSTTSSINLQNLDLHHQCLKGLLLFYKKIYRPAGFSLGWALQL